MCGAGTEFDEILKAVCRRGMDTSTSVNKKCASKGGADCYCDSYGYGTRGTTRVAHSSCQKYVPCFEGVDGSHIAAIMQCEP